MHMFDFVTVRSYGLEKSFRVDVFVIESIEVDISITLLLLEQGESGTIGNVSVVSHDVGVYNHGAAVCMREVVRTPFHPNPTTYSKSFGYPLLEIIIYAKVFGPIKK